jgi:hypothetical protein
VDGRALAIKDAADHFDDLALRAAALTVDACEISVRARFATYRKVWTENLVRSSAPLY